MSTKLMPGIGKSGKCLRAERRLIFAPASSEALEEVVEVRDSTLEAFLSSEEIARWLGIFLSVVIVEGKEER